VVGLPGFIGVVGIPLGILLALYVNRNKLADVNVRKAFGFLYMGMEQDYYFWEVVVMGRKIAIVLISVFLRSAGTQLQLACALGVIAFFFVLHITYMPFKNDLLDSLEKYSIMGSLMIYYLGLMFFSVEGVWGRPALVTISVAIVLTNVFMFGFFIQTMFLEVIKQEVLRGDTNNDGVVDGREMTQHAIKTLPMGLLKTRAVSQWLARIERPYWVEKGVKPRTAAEIREVAIKIKQGLSRQAGLEKYYWAVDAAADLPERMVWIAAPLLVKFCGKEVSLRDFKDNVRNKREVVREAYEHRIKAMGEKSNAGRKRPRALGNVGLRFKSGSAAVHPSGGAIPAEHLESSAAGEIEPLATVPAPGHGPGPVSEATEGEERRGSWWRSAEGSAATGHRVEVHLPGFIPTSALSLPSASPRRHPTLVKNGRGKEPAAQT